MLNIRIMMESLLIKEVTTLLGNETYSIVAEFYTYYVTDIGS